MPYLDARPQVNQLQRESIEQAASRLDVPLNRVMVVRAFDPPTGHVLVNLGGVITLRVDSAGTFRLSGDLEGVLHASSSPGGDK